MKKSLKQWKELTAKAKAAWAKAKASDESEASEVESLRADYLKHLAVVEEAEASGAKETDMITVDKKSWEAKDSKAADESEDEDSDSESDEGEKGGEVLLTDIKDTIVEAVKEALNGQGKEGEITAGGIKSILREVLGEHEVANAKRISKATAKEIVEDVIAKQKAALKKKSKMQFSEEEGDQDPDEEGEKQFKRFEAEYPVGPRKGNLPVHQKQLLNVLMQRPQDEGIDRRDLERAQRLGDGMIQKYVNMARAGQKALTSTGSATGDEWVPTDVSAELQRRFFLASELGAIFAGQEIDMPTQPYKYPFNGTRPTFYLETTENTAATASTPSTGEISLSAPKLMGEVDFSYEMDEDSIVPVLSNLQTLLAEAAADAWEDGLINGDTTATHQDSDTELVAKAGARAFKGFRKLALAVAALKIDISSGGLSEANLRSLKKALGKYGVRRNDLVWIVGPKGENDIAAISNLSTQEKVGGIATILTGEIRTLLGAPIVVSERCREDLNASGVYDNTTTTKGSILLVNRSRFITGRRRAFTIEIDKNIKSQTHEVVASYRRGMVPVETPSATVPSVVIGYNYTA